MIFISINSTSRIITAPVLIPDTPDCDYNNGETPLNISQIKNLQSSFKNYQIIDHDHQFCNNGDWYLKKLGTPIKSWISNKSITFTDVNNTTHTVPSGTWWLKSEITDPQAIQLIDSKQLTAYSLTTANQIYADKIMNLLIQKNNTSKIYISQDIELYLILHNSQVASKSELLLCPNQKFKVMEIYQSKTDPNCEKVIIKMINN